MAAVGRDDELGFGLSKPHKVRVSLPTKKVGRRIWEESVSGCKRVACRQWSLNLSLMVLGLDNLRQFRRDLGRVHFASS
jgi:hypothetical protein